MTHRGDGTEPHLAVVGDGVDLGVDDDAHRLIVACGPQQPERTVTPEEFDRPPAHTDHDRVAGEAGRDMGDPWRAVGIGDHGIGRRAVAAGLVDERLDRNLHAHGATLTQPSRSRWRCRWNATVLPPTTLRAHHRALGLGLAIAIAASLVTSARADEADGGSAPPDATSGAVIEETLSAVGLEAVWRAATGVGDIARSARVVYRADEDEVLAARLLALATSTDTVRRQRDRIVESRRVAAVDVTDATDAERQRRIERDEADGHLRDTVALVQSVAIDLFAGSGDVDDELLGGDGQAVLHAQRTHELRGHTLEELLEQRERAMDALARAENDLVEAGRRLVRAEETHERLTIDFLVVAQRWRELRDETRALLPRAADAFVAATVPGEPNLTVRALDAYIRAESVWTELAPDCAISWRTIAAVGAIESAHGHHGGRELGPDGRPDRPILGLPLDGVSVDNFGETVAAVPDTDGGRHDGDSVNDRAVGPMQFIPETWARWAADGDGDGRFDPHDLDDAAVAAGGLLCNHGTHRDWESWKDAVFAYNQSAHYVAAVKDAHERLQQVTIPAVGEAGLRPGRPAGTYVPMPIPEPEKVTPDG